MPTTALIRKPIEAKSPDLALCKRLAQEACRRASAAKSWAVLVFGRLNRQRWRSRLRTGACRVGREGRGRAASALPPRSCTS